MALLENKYGSSTTLLWTAPLFLRVFNQNRIQPYCLLHFWKMCEDYPGNYKKLHPFTIEISIVVIKYLLGFLGWGLIDLRCLDMRCVSFLLEMLACTKRVVKAALCFWQSLQVKNKIHCELLIFTGNWRSCWAHCIVGYTIQHCALLKITYFWYSKVILCIQKNIPSVHSARGHDW